MIFQIAGEVLQKKFAQSHAAKFTPGNNLVPLEDTQENVCDRPVDDIQPGYFFPVGNSDAWGGSSRAAAREDWEAMEFSWG